MENEKKKRLLKLMNSVDMGKYDAIACINGLELVATKLNYKEELWWREISVEGSGFENLFRGSIKKVFDA